MFTTSPRYSQSAGGLAGMCSSLWKLVELDEENFLSKNTPERKENLPLLLLSLNLITLK